MREDVFPPPPGGEGKNIRFYAEDLDFQLPDPELVARWIEAVLNEERKPLLQLGVIFCSDNYLHRLNVDYLQHDTLTDIITFPYSPPPLVEGDLFISIERVRENAKTYGADPENELHRVLIHGVLHLCGYADKNPEDKSRMTSREDKALALLQQMRNF